MADVPRIFLNATLLMRISWRESALSGFLHAGLMDVHPNISLGTLQSIEKPTQLCLGGGAIRSYRRGVPAGMSDFDAICGYTSEKETGWN